MLSQRGLVSKTIIFCKLLIVNFSKTGFRGRCGGLQYISLNRGPMCKLAHANVRFNMRIVEIRLEVEAG